MSKAQVYEVLMRFSDMYSSKPNKFMITRLSEKLEEYDPKHLEAALDHHSESNKFFPNFKDITDALREVKSKFAQAVTACPKCGGQGQIID